MIHGFHRFALVFLVASMPQAAAAAPPISHDQVYCAGAGQTLTLSVRIEDTTQIIASVYFRSQQHPNWDTAYLRKGSGDQWSGVVPADRVLSPYVEYYLYASRGQEWRTAPESGMQSPYRVTVSDNALGCPTVYGPLGLIVLVIAILLVVWVRRRRRRRDADKFRRGMEQVWQPVGGQDQTLRRL